MLDVGHNWTDWADFNVGCFNVKNAFRLSSFKSVLRCVQVIPLTEDIGFILGNVSLI